MAIYEYYIKKAIDLLSDAGKDLNAFKRELIYVKRKEQLNSKKIKIVKTGLVETINQKAPSIFRKMNNYLAVLKEVYKVIGYTVYVVEMTTATRFIINVNDSFMWLASEVGLAWDKDLDVPYIPSTSIKGVIGTAIEYFAIKRGYNKLEAKKLREKILGSQKRISLVEITDAYPINHKNEEKQNEEKNKKKMQKELVVPDVITPIYREGPEEDKAKPNPIPFITINKGVKFKFLIIIKTSENDLLQSLSTKNEYQTLKDLLEDILRTAFCEIGLGAKTATGYSYFKDIKVKLGDLE